MSHYYDVPASMADKESIRQARRALTELELSLQPDGKSFDFTPDFTEVHRHTLNVSMAMGSILDRHEGTDFAPSLVALPSPV